MSMKQLLFSFEGRIGRMPFWLATLGIMVAMLVIGFAAGDIPKIPLNLPLIKGCSIVGVWIGAFSKREPARHRANAVELWKWFAQGKIKPHVSAKYPLENAADALNALASRTVAGKVVLTTEA